MLPVDVRPTDRLDAGSKSVDKPLSWRFLARDFSAWVGLVPKQNSRTNEHSRSQRRSATRRKARIICQGIGHPGFRPGVRAPQQRNTLPRSVRGSIQSSERRGSARQHRGIRLKWYPPAEITLREAWQRYLEAHLARKGRSERTTGGYVRPRTGLYRMAGYPICESLEWIRRRWPRSITRPPRARQTVERCKTHFRSSF
jgi:hypothetical protein